MIWENVSEEKRKEVRNKWYKLGYVLSDNSGRDTVQNVALKAGFVSSLSLKRWMDIWGDKLAEQYGKLPYCVLNSRNYEKYMEVK